MALVPVQTNSASNKRSATTLTTPQSPSETCCFLSCNKRATLLCEDCSDIYCPDCCTIVHKSAKFLWSHKQGPIKTKTLKQRVPWNFKSARNITWIWNTIALRVRRMPSATAV